MNSSPAFRASLASLVLTLVAPRQARALGPVDIEVAAVGGYATNPSGYDPNPLGVGLGLRAGVTFLNIYAGVSFLYNLGGTTQGTNNLEGISGPETLTSMQYGVELGYGYQLPVIPLTLRAQVGLGNYGYTPSGVGFCGTDTSCSTSNSFYFEPGVVALISWKHLFAGADIDAFVIPFSPTNSGTTALAALALHGQVGVRF